MRHLLHYLHSLLTAALVYVTHRYRMQVIILLFEKLGRHLRTLGCQETITNFLRYLSIFCIYVLCICMYYVSVFSIYYSEYQIIIFQILLLKFIGAVPSHIYNQVTTWLVLNSYRKTRFFIAD